MGDWANRGEALTLADYRRMEQEGRITRPLTDRPHMEAHAAAGAVNVARTPPGAAARRGGPRPSGAAQRRAARERQEGLGCSPARTLADSSRDRSRGCWSGEVRYPDHRAAIGALRRVRSGEAREVTPARVYECDWCQGWHLTSKRGVE